MEGLYCLLFLLLVLLFLISKRLLETKRTSPNLPPTPPSFPLIGHIHLLRKPLHRTLAHLSSIYGPVFSLRLGHRPALVVSSPSVAEECFTKNDLLFANRPRLLANIILGYNCTALGCVPHGPLWRNLRRLTSLEILSTTRTQEFSAIRHDEANSLLRKLVRDAGKVELRPKFQELSFNVMMRMMTGKSYHGDDEEVGDAEEAKRVRGIIRELFLVGGTAVLGDAFPNLRWVDLGGWEKRMVKLQRVTDAFMQGMIEEHRLRRLMEDAGETATTLIDVMLSMQQADPGFYTDEIIKGVVVVMITENGLPLLKIFW